MTHKTVLNKILRTEAMSRESVVDQIKHAALMVTEGRYLITLFEAPETWDSSIPIESLVLSETLGPIENRNFDWEFFGNGAIRCYAGKNLKLVKTLQWTILRKSGDKPYKRRSEISIANTKKNIVPVKDPVFTRDVANNVWHLLEKNLNQRVIDRFSSLLTWQDEDFIFVNGEKTTMIKNRNKLDLSVDLVGVPTKIPYEWNSGNKLF